MLRLCGVGKGEAKQSKMHSKIRDSFQSQCVSKIPETITKSQSGILSTYFQEYIYAKHLIPFKASENSFYIPKNDQIRLKRTKYHHTFSKYVLDLLVEQFAPYCEARFSFFKTEKKKERKRERKLVITMAKLRMAHASTHGAHKPPGPKEIPGKLGHKFCRRYSV